MGLISFAHEFESPVAPSRLFKALMLDSHVLLPKLMSESIKSIDIIQGDGGVGSIKQTNFAQGVLLKYAKHRIDELDPDKFRMKCTMIEGDMLGKELKSVGYEVELEDDGNGGTICKMSSNYYTDGDVEYKDEDIEEGKERAMEMYRVVEKYLLLNPNAYT